MENKMDNNFGDELNLEHNDIVNDLYEMIATIELEIKNGDVSDIRKCAEFVGEFNISDDDIKYGLMYGRSVIAEYLC